MTAHKGDFQKNKSSIRKVLSGVGLARCCLKLECPDLLVDGNALF